MIAFIVNCLKLPAQFVVAIMNVISITCIFLFIKKMSVNWNMSLLIYLIYLFTFEMQSSRSGVAISLVALGSVYLMQKKFVPFFIFIFFAYSFHKSAIIALILIPLVYLNINLYMGMWIVFAEMIFVKTIGVDKIVLRMLQMTGQWQFYRKYLGYSQSISFGHAFRLYDPRLWLVLMLFILSKCFIKNEAELKDRFMTNCVYMSGVLMIFFSEHTIFAYRFSAFFSIFSLILFPAIINRLEINGKRKLKTQMDGKWKEIRVFGAFVYFLWTLFYVSYINMVDYKLFFIN